MGHASRKMARRRPADRRDRLRGRRHVPAVRVAGLHGGPAEPRGGRGLLRVDRAVLPGPGPRAHPRRGLRDPHRLRAGGGHAARGGPRRAAQRAAGLRTRPGPRRGPGPAASRSDPAVIATLFLTGAVLAQGLCLPATRASRGLRRPAWVLVAFAAMAVSVALMSRALALGVPLAVGYGIWS